VAWKRTILDAARRSGVLGAVGRIYGADRITVLAYHRVVDHTAPGFPAFAGNVSASPQEFAEQMEWLSRRFTVVSLDEVVAAVRGAPLPNRAALITFDDGYRDNRDHALPVLRRLGLPAVLFVATDHIRTGDPFWWDRVAAVFAAGEGAADLPLLGPTRWVADDARALASRWIARAKELPDGELRSAVEDLAAVRPGLALDGLVLDWDGVRQMAAHGVAIGGHTRTHPILTRVSPERASDEIRRGREEVQAEVGGPVLGFAYPNGMAADFDDSTVSAVAAAGFRVAFSLVPGPSRRRELAADPLRVRRIYIHHGDGLARFAAKVAGVPRLTGAMR